MTDRPGIDEIIGVAERVGIGITSTEAEVYRSYLGAILDEFDDSSALICPRPHPRSSIRPAPTVTGRTKRRIR